VCGAYYKQTYLLSFFSFFPFLSKMTSLGEILSTDIWYAKLNDPTQKWGDIMLEYEEAHPNWAADAAAATADSDDDIIFEFATLEEAILADYEVPDLRLRKGIWENFPVDVTPIRSTDGTDRYRISWNAAKLEEWSNTKPLSFDEHDEYEEWCRVRLLYSLERHSHKYTLEPATDDATICVIAMVHNTPDHSLPALTRRGLDVLKAFNERRGHLVSWDRSDKVHRIKLHRVNAAKKGVTENDVRVDLLAELATCSDCIVTPAVGGGYMMTVTLL